MSNQVNYKPMDKEAASRIQSTQTKNEKDVGASSFTSRAQSAGDRNANTAQKGSNQTGNQSKQ
ncbi:hypothetical protein BY458DRAFT_430567 [Sporodiniella umbellata]|nr:hypothetical protein BY458DRAFT_430567 [Sporodiniella umbellata]